MNSNNFLNRGNPNDSGNIESTNGSTNSAHSVEGGQVGSSDIQRIVDGHGPGHRHGRQLLPL
ncbi:hypothetical protein [Streptomyces halobius]|uniref:Uncharacterized protein n=1 Tax=Streptomyces halobius TaxID=2879846 RepID=A0ABY4M9I9_9ACTN|nr:hypothetical protein [Streptomyces halobius]UQA94407.1 hypothetical protein K9S39_23345 [Streptomyces halobius]